MPNIQPVVVPERFEKLSPEQQAALLNDVIQRLAQKLNEIVSVVNQL